MNNKLNRVILWTVYIFTVIILLFTLITLCINVIAPTYFPQRDISGFKNYISTFCVILSFLSVGLGIFSIWQASASSKQAKELIESIQIIKQQQEKLFVILKSTNELLVVSTNKSDGKWVKDDVIK